MHNLETDDNRSILASQTGCSNPLGKPSEGKELLASRLASANRRTSRSSHSPPQRPEQFARLAAAQALVFYRGQCEVEDRSKELSVADRLALRKNESAGIMGELHDWLIEKSSDPRVLPKSAIGKAVRKHRTNGMTCQCSWATLRSRSTSTRPRVNFVA